MEAQIFWKYFSFVSRRPSLTSKLITAYESSAIHAVSASTMTKLPVTSSPASTLSIMHSFCSINRMIAAARGVNKIRARQQARIACWQTAMVVHCTRDRVPDCSARTLKAEEPKFGHLNQLLKCQLTFEHRCRTPNIHWCSFMHGASMAVARVLLCAPWWNAARLLQPAAPCQCPSSACLHFYESTLAAPAAWLRDW